MIIFGMTGPIGHGKSTFAEALVAIEPASKRFESSLIISEVVNALHATTTKIPDRDNLDSINEWLRPLPSILLETVHAHCTFDQIKLQDDEIARHPVEYSKLLLHIDNLTRQPELLKQEITRENKESYRPILQWIGGYMPQKVDPAIWYKEIVRRVYEAQDQGCKLCIIGGLRFPTDAAQVRQAGGKIIKVYRPGHIQYDMLDPTERERDNIQVDSTIASNGTVEDVGRCAVQVLDDARNNRLQTYYQTAPSSPAS